MKKFNLIERLLTDSHEKQRVHGMRRYAAMLLLLVMCITHAWADETYYLKSGTTTWSTSNYGWSISSNNGTTKAYMAKDGEFKFYHPDWGDQNSWMGSGTDCNLYENGDNGHIFYQNGASSYYKGPSGMVCFHMVQTGSSDYHDWQPYVWITRPTW